MTAENMAHRRQYRRIHGRRESPESRKKSMRKYRITSYGITQDIFNQILVVQGNGCGMCHEPFDDGQLIHVDHDHACCNTRKQACGKCIRGLLCHVCNIALGHIERRYAMARAYLEHPPGQRVLAHSGGCRTIRNSCWRCGGSVGRMITAWERGTEGDHGGDRAIARPQRS